MLSLTSPGWALARSAVGPERWHCGQGAFRFRGWSGTGGRSQVLTQFCWFSKLNKAIETRRVGDLKFMSRMRSAVEWSKQMDLDDEEKANVGGGERQRGTWEEVD